MKKTILLASVASMMLVSCSTLKNNSSTASSSTSASTSSAATATTSDAVQMGKNAGAALDYLTAQYKSAGKLDMTNMMNIASMLNLVGAAQQVYQNKSDSNYRKAFISGMVSNSLNVTDNNAESITDKLQSLAENTNADKLQEAIQKGQATATEVENVTSSVTNIINMFKK